MKTRTTTTNLEEILGDDFAPEGSKPWAIAKRNRISDGLQRLPTNIDFLRDQISAFCKYKAWEHFLDEFNQPFKSFTDFIVSRKGLHSSVNEVREILHDSPQRILFEQTLGEEIKKGGINNIAGKNQFTKTEESPEEPVETVKKERKSKQGTSVEYTVRRLSKERPDLLSRVESGELSCNQAAIEAGWRKIPTALDALQKAWDKASQSDREAFLRERQDDARAILKALNPEPKTTTAGNKPTKQKEMFEQPHRPGEGWQRANEQRIGILGVDYTDQELKDYFSLNTDEARAKFVDRLLNRFSMKFDWTWPVLYQMLEIAKTQEVWKRTELLEEKKQYASFEEYFTDVIKEPFETFLELEQTHQFFTGLQPKNPEKVATNSAKRKPEKAKVTSSSSASNAIIPRAHMPKDSTEYAERTVGYFKRLWKSLDTDFERIDQVLNEIDDSKAWEKYPTDKPYGSLDLLLLAEIGESEQSVRTALRRGRPVLQSVIAHPNCEPIQNQSGTKNTFSLGDPKADIGTPGWAELKRARLLSTTKYVHEDFENMWLHLKPFIETRAWTMLTAGEKTTDTFTSFQQFVTTLQPWGLGELNYTRFLYLIAAHEGVDEANRIASL